MSDRTWFITGASRGFGRSFTQAALAAGDRVAATARDTSSLNDLVAEHGDAILPIELDVTDRAAAFTAVGQTYDRFGDLDVVVNNAGYGVAAAIEELTEAQARQQIEVNLFGALWVTQAALPILREQGSGWIVQVLDRRPRRVPAHRHLPCEQVGPWRGSRRRCARRSSHSGSRC